jgi:hypothetical protein
MLVKLILGVAGALWALPPNACASENVTSSCVDVSVPRNAVIARNGQWIELTSKQWQFLRGVYVLNPQTPPGLPYGDKAVLARSTRMPADWCSLSTVTGLHSDARASRTHDPDGRSRN